MTLVSHIGTHIDAPAHVVKNGKSLDKYDLDKFIGNAIVIDCRKENELTMKVIKKYEQRIKKVDFVLFYTGWQDRWNTDRYLKIVRYLHLKYLNGWHNLILKVLVLIHSQ